MFRIFPHACVPVYRQPGTYLRAYAQSLRHDGLGALPPSRVSPVEGTAIRIGGREWEESKEEGSWRCA